MFGERDLSGLRFGSLGGAPTNLSGADFTQADLSGTEADEILVHQCSFNGARLDGCRWRQPVFAFADMRRSSAKQVKWGTLGRRGSARRSLANFSHTVLHYADLSEARICGFFYGTKMVGACLRRADLSFSDFLGPKYYDVSFSTAQLSGAKLRHCQISSATFFNADCTGADFSHSDFRDVRMNGCNLSGARFRNAEFERWMISPDQMCQADLREAIDQLRIETGRIKEQNS
jgi:uncharacterized protein YjbI with pentapeptide repeats